MKAHILHIGLVGWMFLFVCVVSAATIAVLGVGFSRQDAKLQRQHREVLALALQTCRSDEHAKTALRLALHARLTDPESSEQLKAATRKIIATKLQPHACTVGR